MPKSIRFKGASVYRPGVITFHNLDDLLNKDLSSEAAVLVIGEAAAGQPQASVTAPVVHTFQSSDAMIDTFISGNLAETAKFLFDPAKAGQYARGGVPIKGCDTVYAIKTNLSLQASFSVRDSYPGGNVAFTVEDRIWGALGNQTYINISAVATGLKFVAGRATAPNVGSQDSDDTGQRFSITGTDEWMSVVYTGGAVAATMTFNGTTWSTTTTGNVDDISIIGTGLTLTELANLISTTAGGAGGTYAATVLRADRANVVCTYMDRCTAVDIKGPAPAAPNTWGVSYDMVTWINSNCDYVSATWVAGYEPAVNAANAYLTGGAIGDSSSDRITYALQIASRLGIRHVVSGFDSDSVGGAVALATINPLFTTHATNCNRIGSIRERHVYISVDDATKAAMYTTLAAINNENVTAFNNRLYREGPADTKVWMNPHVSAAAVAAMCAGSPRATPMLWKVINASDTDFIATDFDPTNDTDFANGIKNGLCFFEIDPDDGGIRVAKGITTYSSEDNDGRIMMETVHARMWHKILLRRFQKRVIGQKSAGVLTGDEILDITKDAHRLMADPSDPDFLLVAGTDEDGNYVPAYQNLTVTSSGGAFYVTGQVHFTTGVTWIFNDIAGLMPTSFSA